MRHCLSVAAIMLAAASSSAFAGVVITAAQINLASKEETPIRGFIEADRLKIVTPQATVIFRNDLKTAWIIGGTTYLEITPEVVSTFAGRLAAVQAPGSPEQTRLQERLAKLPPEQRALAEQQLKSLGAGTAPQVAYTKTGQGKTVGAWRCELYDKSVSGQKQEELCVAPIATLGLNDADIHALELFTTFMGPVASSPVAPRADYFNWTVMSKAIGFSGIPLQAVLLSNGGPSLQDTVQKVERMNIPADAFDLPAGLTKRAVAGQR